MAEVTSDHNASGILRIFINDILHLMFCTKSTAGVQSWNDTKIRSPAMYFIEITSYKGASILAEYDDAQIWKDVLAKISQVYGRTP